MIIPIGDENPTKRVPYVHYAIIAINCVVFVLINFRSDFESIVKSYGFTPGHPQFLSLFTSMFMHGDIFHLLGNMLYLWIFGDNVEDSVGIFYLPLYLCFGLAATGLHSLFNLGSAIPCIGASGAISGVLGFYLIFFPWHRVKFFYFWGGRWSRWSYPRAGTFYLEAVWAIGSWFILQLIFAFLSGSGIAYWAHIGGFGFGVAAALFWKFAVLSKPETAKASVAGETRAVNIPPAKWRDNPNQVLTSLNVPGSESDFLYAFDRNSRLYGEARLDPEHHLRAGEICVERKDFERASRIYQEFLKIYPDHAESQKTMYFLGMVLVHKLDSPAKGAGYFRQLVSLSNVDKSLLDYARQELEALPTKAKEITTDINRGDLSGECMVMQRTHDRIPALKIADSIVKITGQNRIDVIRQINFSGGIIAKNLTPDQARAVASYLQLQDIQVLIVDESKILELPPAKIVHKAEVSDEGIFVESAVDKKLLRWPDIYFAVAGKKTLKLDVLFEEVETGRRYASVGGHDIHPIGRVTPVQVKTATTIKEYLITIVSADLQEKYQFSSEKTFVSGIKSDLEFIPRLKGLFLLAGELLRHPDIHCSDSVTWLAEEKTSDDLWRERTFQSQFHMDEYTLWLVHLAKYGDS